MPTALQNLDWAGVKLLHELAISSPLMACLFYTAAEVILFFFAFLLWYLWRRPLPVAKHHGNQKAVMLAIMSVVLSLAIKTLIGLVVFRARPFISHPELLPFPLHVDSASFPSSHSLITMAIAASIWFSGNRRLGGWLIAAACLVGIGRIGAGVHYPSDVLAGLSIGYLVAYLLHREASSIKKYLPDHA